MADSFRGYSYLEHLSVERLEELLDSAVNADEEENSEYIDAILEVIVKKEKEAPSGRFTDINKAWNDFQTYYNTEDGHGQTLYFSEDQEQLATATPRNHKILRRIWKTALIAAATVICLMISVVAAQAAGFNVLGALAHWTDGVFSFGNLQPEAVDTSFSDETNSPTEEPAKSVETLATSQNLSYSSLQDALDAFSITEISEPTNLPSGYTLDRIRGGNTKRLSLDARYINGEDVFTISLIAHGDNPSMQLEKTDEAVEVVNINGFDCYFFKNIDNYTVTWLTEHYECFVFAPLDIGRNVLQEIITDML